MAPEESSTRSVRRINRGDVAARGPAYRPLLGVENDAALAWLGRPLVVPMGKQSGAMMRRLPPIRKR
jgi:hypothetical protein